MAKPRPAKPRPPRRSRVESALASIEARLRGDARAAVVVRKGAARRTMRRNMIDFAVVSEAPSFCLPNELRSQASRAALLVQRTRVIYTMIIKTRFDAKLLGKAMCFAKS